MRATDAAGMLLALNLVTLPEIGLSGEFSDLVRPHLSVQERLVIVVSHTSQTSPHQIGITRAQTLKVRFVSDPTFVLTGDRAFLLSGPNLVSEIFLENLVMHASPVNVLFSMLDSSGVPVSESRFSLELDRKSVVYPNIVERSSPDDPNSNKLFGAVLELLVHIQLYQKRLQMPYLG